MKDQVMVTGATRDLFEADVNGKMFDGWRIVPGTVAVSIAGVVSMASGATTFKERWVAVLEREKETK